MSETLTEAQIATIHRALIDFGYSGLSHGYVREQAETVLTGTKPDNVIAMFVKGWLRDAGMVT